MVSSKIDDKYGSTPLTDGRIWQGSLPSNQAEKARAPPPDPKHTCA